MKRKELFFNIFISDYYICIYIYIHRESLHSKNDEYIILFDLYVKVYYYDIPNNNYTTIRKYKKSNIRILILQNFYVKIFKITILFIRYKLTVC